MTQELLKLLAQARSATTGTSLITLFITPNTDLWLSNKKLTTELSTASNIKSKQVRKAVITALKSCLQVLSGLNKAPKNGYVLLAGQTEQYFYQW